MIITFFRKILFCLCCVISLIVFTACSSKTTATIPNNSGLQDLIDAVDSNGNLDTEITITVKNSIPAQNLNTTAVGAVQPVLLEVDASSPKGKPFKAVLLGSSDNAVATGFSDKVRVRAKKTEVSGEAVIAGFAALPSQTDKQFPGFSFLAVKEGVTLESSEVGSIYNMDGQAGFKGFCTDNHLVGASLFKNRLETVKVVNATLVLLNDRLPCEASRQLDATVQMNFESEVVDTHLGKVLSSYGVMQVQLDGQAYTMPLFTVGVPELLSDSIKQARFEASIAANVFVIDPFFMSAIEDIRKGVILMRELPEGFKDLEAGDILVARPFPRLTQGAVRTVTFVEQREQGVAIATDVADLSKVFLQGGFKFQRPLTAEDLLEDVVAAEGVDVSAFNDIATLRAQALARKGLSSRALRSQALDLLPRVTINKEIFSGIRLEGYIDVGAEPVFEFECRKAFCAELKVVGKFVVTEEAELALIGEYSAGYAETFELLTIPLGTIVIYAGVPITVTPNISFTVTVDANGALDLNVVATQSLELEVGVEKPFGEGFKPVKEFSKETNFTVDYNGSFEAGARAAVRASITVLGTLSAYADLGPYIEFEAQFPNDPLWELRGGINSYAGLEYDLLLIEDDVSFLIFDRNYKIASGENTEPEIIDFSYDGEVFEEGSVTKFPPDEPITFYASVLDPEEGSDCCNISWTLFKDNRLEVPQQETSAPNQSYSFTPNEVGNYSLQLRSEDTQGLSADLYTFDFTIEPNSIFDLPPEIITFDWTPEVTTIAAGTEINFTLRTDHPTLEDCCDVRWFINPGQLLNDPAETTEGETATVGRLHTFTRIPINPGTYTIRAEVVSEGLLEPGTFRPFRQVTFTVVDEGNQPPELDYIDIWEPAVGLPEVGEEVVFVAEFNDDNDVQGQGRSFDLEFIHAGESFATVPESATVPFAIKTFDTSGLTTITVIATDQDGESTTATYSFQVRGESPWRGR